MVLCCLIKGFHTFAKKELFTDSVTSQTFCLFCKACQKIRSSKKFTALINWFNVILANLANIVGKLGPKFKPKMPRYIWN